jgi:hypothetical protein
MKLQNVLGVIFLSSLFFSCKPQEVFNDNEKVEWDVQSLSYQNDKLIFTAENEVLKVNLKQISTINVKSFLKEKKVMLNQVSFVLKSHNKTTDLTFNFNKPIELPSEMISF